jgi:hypothetical protein
MYLSRWRTEYREEGKGEKRSEGEGERGWSINAGGEEGEEECWYERY